jgi:HD-GYP domain-containing protein (c-di-GMP phosphodiesterase class II)
VQAYWAYIYKTAPVLQLQLKPESELAERFPEVFCKGVCKEEIGKLSNSVSISEFEQSVTFPAQQDATWLRSELRAVLSDEYTLSQLFEHGHDQYLHDCSVLLVRYPQIVLRLHLLKNTLDYEYSQTLFNILMVCLESKHSKRTAEEFEKLCLCVFCHDLGLLELDINLTISSHDRRSEHFERERYFEHVDLAVAFANTIEGIGDDVVRGIREHHENMDGTGYPQGKIGLQLSEFGQHIHLYDTIFSVFHKYYRPLGKSLADVLPIIKMNAVTHFGAIANTVIELLAEAETDGETFFGDSDLENILTHTRAMDAYVSDAIEAIQEFTHAVGFRHDERALLALQNSFFHLALARGKTESLDKNLLFHLPSESFGYEQSKRLENQYFSLREMIYHVNKFIFLIGRYQLSCEFDEVKEAVKAAGEKLSRLNAPSLEFKLNEPV